MSESLFRPEAVQNRQARWLGRISLRRPPSQRWWTAGALLIAALTVALLVLGDYTRRTRVAGELVPSQGMAVIPAPATGTLSRVAVAEGDTVRAGELLAVVSVPRETADGVDVGVAVQAAMAQRSAGVSDAYASQRSQLEAQAGGLGLQINAAREELALLEQEIETRRAQHRLAGEALARFRKLRAEDFVTDLQVQQQEAAWLDSQALVQSLARQALAQRRELAQLAQAAEEVPARLAALDAGERRDSAALVQESAELRLRNQAAVLAPLDGSVAALAGLAGQAVQAGQVLLSVLPASGQLEAHLMVPSQAVGFVEPGDRVLLRYRSFPYQKFGHHEGRVQRVSRAAFGAMQSPDASTAAAGDSYYRVVVTLERQSVRAFGREEALRPGMALEADILGERRPLWEWLVEPLFTIAGAVSDRSPTLD